MSDESELVAQAATGDEQAFALLLDGCRQRSWAVVYRICGDAHDAEDALQDAAIAAWRHLDTFRGGARFSTWFYRIAANAALQVVRRRRDQPHAEIAELADTHTGGIDDRVTAGMVVQTALAQLRPEFRAALVLREWGGLSYQEIADWQQVPIQTVKSRLNRARTAVAGLVGEVA